MLRIYGSTHSRAIRPLWLLQELSLSYEFVPIDFSKKENRTPSFLAMNPYGRVPVLQDGLVTIFESAAICNYLARKDTSNTLIPRCPKLLAEYDQWMFFVMSELDAALWTGAKHRFALPAEYRVPGMAAVSRYEFDTALRVVAQHLTDRDYLLGNQACVADFMLAQTLMWAGTAKISLDDPSLECYLKRMKSRPSFAQLKDKHLKK